MAMYIDKWQAVANLMDAHLKDTAKAVDAIQYMDAADVRPVIHGKWIHPGGKFSRDKNVDRRILTCSICGNMLSMEGVNAGRGDANFCPNCGADMREES